MKTIRKPRTFKLNNISYRSEPSVSIDSQYLVLQTRSSYGHFHFGVKEQKRLLKWLQRNIAWLESKK